MLSKDVQCIIFKNCLLAKTTYNKFVDSKYFRLTVLTSENGNIAMNGKISFFKSNYC